MDSGVLGRRVEKGPRKMLRTRNLLLRLRVSSR